MRPYREGPGGARPRAASGEGAVAEMVRQFADPYAFARELVQNGLDAGATRLLVRLDRTPDGLATSAVVDDGRGMTRAIIEGPLLTLFMSSKEDDSSKIGKYGVGFVSVFALDPDEVTVETWRGGEAWLVRLRPDHTYELEAAEPRDGSGTIVTLLRRMSSDAFAAHAAQIEHSLRRWCRHAERPIELTVVDRERAAAATTARVDTPLAVRASVSVELTIDETRYVVGCAAGAERMKAGPPTAVHLAESPRFAGFYNRGLTLFESVDEELPGLHGVRFKVLSRVLAHTLSRDNVRRDAAFERALDQVRGLVKGALRAALVKELAERASRAAEGELDPYLAALEAALGEPFELGAKELVLPLASPVDGKRALAASALKKGTSRSRPFLTSASPSALTAVLARAGRPVVLAPHPLIELVLACRGLERFVDAKGVYGLARELPATEADRAFLEAVRATLSAAGSPVARVALARFDAPGLLGCGFAVRDGGGAERLLELAELEEAGRRWPEPALVLLDDADVAVTRARTGTAEERATRGHLLARLLLVERRGVLAPSDNERLLEAALGDEP